MEPRGRSRSKSFYEEEDEGGKSGESLGSTPMPALLDSVSSSSSSPPLPPTSSSSSSESSCAPPTPSPLSSTAQKEESSGTDVVPPEDEGDVSIRRRSKSFVKHSVPAVDNRMSVISQPNAPPKLQVRTGERGSSVGFACQESAQQLVLLGSAERATIGEGLPALNQGRG